jgi:hypothetical protein
VSRIARWSSLALLFVVVVASPSLAGQVRISLSGTSFTPSTVQANLGDQIVWLWVSGGHTVTSGTDGSLAGDGKFNSGADSAASSRPIRLEDDAPGAFPSTAFRTSRHVGHDQRGAAGVRFRISG